jgi:arylsulfatase A-like enzyme
MLRSILSALRPASAFLTLASLFLLPACAEPTNGETADAASTHPPNIIYILADDLGYGELGAYGQDKIETPHIDSLAANGMLFSQHYTSAPVCAPARYMLLTGRHAGHAHVRGNHEWRARGEVWNHYAMAKDSSLEGQLPLPAATTTLAQRLQSVGYTTGMVGKWGLGAPHTESIPTELGFDFFYGYNCQRQAHTYYPPHLYKNESREYLNNEVLPPGTKLPAEADPQDLASYAPFRQANYAPDLMFAELMQFVDRQAETDDPFFLYWATPIPHVALQAPPRWVDYYVDKFGDEEPYLGDQGYFPSRYPRATYAAMISYLDENVGKLVARLKAMGEYENTLIFFTSDNGPSYAGGADPDFFASAAPFRGERGRGKGYVYEGGIRVPLIAHWPGRIEAGSISNHVSAHYDMDATLADLTGYTLPDTTDGVSFLPTLLREGEQTRHDFLYWEFPEYGGQVAIRMGDWKVVRQNLKNDEEPTLEVYNLRADPLETTDVAAEHPEIVEQAAAIFAREHTNTAVERFRIPAVEAGLVE